MNVWTTAAATLAMCFEALADRVWSVIQDNGYGEWDRIIARLAPSLGASGLAHLKAHVAA